MTTQDNPRDLVFATVFPDWHPKAGKPTYFPWTLCRSKLGRGFGFAEMAHALKWHPHPEDDNEKIHTARKGHDWKVGDWFQPVTEDGVRICSPLQIKWLRQMSVFDHVIARFFLLSKNITIEQREAHAMVNVHDKVEQIAANDGLSPEDFIDWFPNPFDGQLFGWTEDPYNL